MKLRRLSQIQECGPSRGLQRTEGSVADRQALIFHGKEWSCLQAGRKSWGEHTEDQCPHRRGRYNASCQDHPRERRGQGATILITAAC